MGKAQFHVSADLLKALIMDVADLPWPEGTIILQENETEWKTHRRLHVTIQYSSIPDSTLEPLWCAPSWYYKDCGQPVFESWNFHEDWE